VRRTRRNTVRIVGGLWRSRLIEFPDVTGLRPTPDRVRETLFNWLGQDLTGLACLDLFAGSGALGFEALSRGAASVVMVEKQSAALHALQENAQKLGVSNLVVARGDALEFVRESRACFDVVFVDPPYGLGLQAAALTLVRRLLSERGRVYVESDSAFDAPPGWVVLKRARAGGVHFHLLAGGADDQGGISGNI
jgi:16S rRNA (guanine966-N2)-methyltransferase